MTDLSEKAIALIMWERTLRDWDAARAKRASASDRLNKYLDMYGMGSIEYRFQKPVFKMYCDLTDAWNEWLDLCHQYLTARGWEPLP